MREDNNIFSHFFMFQAQYDLFILHYFKQANLTKSQLTASIYNFHKTVQLEDKESQI